MVVISAWSPYPLQVPQTSTADRPDGVLNIDSGVSTCFTPGYYTVSFSANSHLGPSYATNQDVYLYKNGEELPESYWHFWADTGAFNDDIGVTGSRTVVSKSLTNLCKIANPSDSPPGCRRHSGAQNDPRRQHL